jgi:hypothetical protein
LDRVDARPSRQATAAHVALIVAAIPFAQGLFLPLALAALVSKRCSPGTSMEDKTDARLQASLF